MYLSISWKGAICRNLNINAHDIYILHTKLIGILGTINDMTKIVHSQTKFFPILQVIMATKEAAERACKEPNPIIDGRKANVNLAILGAKPRLNSLQGMFLQCHSQL